MTEGNTGHLAGMRLWVRRFWWCIRYAVIIWRRARGITLGSAWYLARAGWDNSRLDYRLPTPSEAVEMELSYWDAD